MSTVCIFPFMHSVVLPNGSINLCCNAEVNEGMPNVADRGIDNILNNPRHIEVRRQMLAGERPSVCRRCWDSEALGIKSYRQQGNFNYLKYYPRTWFANKDGTISSGVKYFDVRFNNTCNLKCVMCSSGYSSAWIDDEKKLRAISTTEELSGVLAYRINLYDKESFKWAKDSEIVDAIIANANSVERIHFAGGEPLLAKQHTVLLNKLVELGLAPKLYLSYNTNGEYITKDLLDTWSKFKCVKVFYSLDHIESKNEYIRFPSNWQLHLEKFKLIEEHSPSNIKWKLLTTVSVLNVAYIPELVEWKRLMNFKKIHADMLDGDLFYGTILEHPTYLNMNVLPDSVKDQIKCKLQSYKFNNRHYRKIVNDILNYMYAESHTEHLPVLKEYLEGLDSIRGTDFRKTFPVLANIL